MVELPGRDDRGAGVQRAQLQEAPVERDGLVRFGQAQCLLAGVGVHELVDDGLQVEFIDPV